MAFSARMAFMLPMRTGAFGGAAGGAAFSLERCVSELEPAIGGLVEAGACKGGDENT